MTGRVCVHCSKGVLTLDSDLGICACESCGLVDEEFQHLQDAAGNEGVQFVAAGGALSAQRVREQTWLSCVDQVASSLRLPPRVVLEIKALVKERLENPNAKGASRRVICAALAMTVCRKMAIPLTFAEAAAAAELSLNAFSRFYRCHQISPL